MKAAARGLEDQMVTPAVHIEATAKTEAAINVAESGLCTVRSKAPKAQSPFTSWRGQENPPSPCRHHSVEAQSRRELTSRNDTIRNDFWVIFGEYWMIVAVRLRPSVQ